MSFRGLAAAAAVACCLWTGCERRPSPEAAAGPELGGADAGCLARVRPVGTRYVLGQSNAAEVSAAWGCAVRSLELFSTRTRGENAGYYTPDELRAFLEKYFLGGLRISDAFLGEGMELKRALIGGQVDKLTQDDLDRARELLTNLERQSLLLLPDMPITPSAASTWSEADASRAAGDLTKAASALGETLEDTGVPYSFAQLDALLSELQTYGGGETSGITVVRDHLLEAQAVKATLIGPGGDTISGGEWKVLLSTGAQAYGLYLRALAWFGELNAKDAARAKEAQVVWWTGPGRESLIQLISSAGDILDGAIARHPREQIRFAELDHLIKVLLPDGLSLGPGITIPDPHLEDFLRPLVQRIMGGAVLGEAGRSAPGLTRPALHGLLGHIAHWSEGERFLEGLYDAAEKAQDVGLGGSGTSFSRADLGAFDLGTLAKLGEIPGLWPGAGIPLSLEDASDRLLTILGSDLPHFRGNDPQAYFPGYGAPAEYSFYDLSMDNLFYELGRLLTQGWAEDPARASTGDDNTQEISFDEFHLFVSQITPIGVDVKYVDPHDPDEASKRFREASLFTYDATGNGFMSSRAAAQLVMLMVSGQMLTNEIHSEISGPGIHCALGPLDQYGYVTIDAGCYRKALFGGYRHFWRNMPRLVSYFGTLTSSEKADFEYEMEVSARKKGHSPAMMDSDDSQGFAMVAQYVEALFGRFDFNDDGILDADEARAAFPVFSLSLQAVTCQTGHCLTAPADLEAVFTYMLAHGTEPNAAEFLAWRYLPFIRDVKADRRLILHIFAALSQQPAPGG